MYRVETQHRIDKFLALAALVFRNTQIQDEARTIGAIRDVMRALRRRNTAPNFQESALKALYALISGNQASQNEARENDVFAVVREMIKLPETHGPNALSILRAVTCVARELVRDNVANQDAALQQVNSHGESTLSQLVHVLKIISTSNVHSSYDNYADRSHVTDLLSDLSSCFTQMVKAHDANRIFLAHECEVVSLLFDFREPKWFRFPGSVKVSRLLFVRELAHQENMLQSEISEQIVDMLRMLRDWMISSINCVCAHGAGIELTMIQLTCEILSLLARYSMQNQVELSMMTGLNYLEALKLAMSTIPMNDSTQDCHISLCIAIRDIVRTLQESNALVSELCVLIVEKMTNLNERNELYRELTMTLREIARESRANQLKANEAGVIMHYADVLRSGRVDVDLQDDLFSTITVLVLNNQDNINSAIDEGVPGIVNNLAHSTPAARNLLDALQIENVEGAANNMQQVIERIASPRGDADALLNDLTQLSRIILGNERLQIRAGELRAVEKCAQAMQWYVANYRVQMAGLSALLALTSNNEENKRTSAEISLYITVFVAMREHAECSELQNLGNAVLDMVLGVVRDRARNTELNGLLNNEPVDGSDEHSERREELRRILHEIQGGDEHDVDALEHFMGRIFDLSELMAENQYIELMNELKDRYERLSANN
jgi:hypothetical protein